MMMRKTLLASFILAALYGCTVGPDYPGAPAVTDRPLGHALAHDRRTQPGVPAVAHWWSSLGDAQLDRLVNEALANSPDIAQARARLRQSRAGLSSQQAAGRPKVSANATMLRMRSPDLSQLSGGEGESSGGGGRGPLSLYLVDFDASWEVDLFGGTRRAIEAAAASAEASEAQLADAQVQLVAEVVQAYADLRDRQQRLALVDASVDIEQQVLELTRQRRSQGVASELQLEQVFTQSETTRAQRLPLQAQIIESLDQLALLCGQAPGELDTRLAAAQPLPTIPAQVPVADPTQLLKARPDIRAAERNLASANAQIGEKQADWFPKLSLMGDLGFSAADPGHLARKSNATWLALPRLTWNALDFGRVKAGIEQAKGGHDLALAEYRGTVLGALRDADTALVRYGHQRENAVMLGDIQASAERAADLTRQRYRAGTASTLDWLDAERTRFQAQQNRVSGDAQLLKDFAALHKSLGLGWSVGDGLPATGPTQNLTKSTRPW